MNAKDLARYKKQYRHSWRFRLSNETEITALQRKVAAYPTRQKHRGYGFRTESQFCAAWSHVVDEAKGGPVREAQAIAALLDEWTTYSRLASAEWSSSNIRIDLSNELVVALLCDAAVAAKGQGGNAEDFLQSEWNPLKWNLPKMYVNKQLRAGSLASFQRAVCAGASLDVTTNDKENQSLVSVISTHVNCNSTLAVALTAYQQRTLRMAVIAGHEEAVSLLVAATDKRVLARRNMGSLNLLRVALDSGREDLALMLLNAGVPVEHPTYGMSLLNEADVMGWYALVEPLLTDVMRGDALMLYHGEKLAPVELAICFGRQDLAVARLKADAAKAEAAADAAKAKKGK